MRAAFYESDITPPLGCFQSGYGFERIAEDVFDKIYSKALVLEDNGSYAVLIAVDLCEYPKDLHDKVAKRIEEYTGIPSERVCIHATHAHLGAPVIDNPQINCYADAPYKDVFYRLVADSAILAYKRLGECKEKDPDLLKARFTECLFTHFPLFPIPNPAPRANLQSAQAPFRRAFHMSRHTR